MYWRESFTGERALLHTKYYFTTDLIELLVSLETHVLEGALH
jgi:hypothetical protein